MNGSEPTQPTRVIKLGGSLLSWPEWSGALTSWLSRQVPATNLIVVGGGPVVEDLRRLDRKLGLGASASHQIAIGMMSVSVRQVARRLGVPVVHPLKAFGRLCGVDVEWALDDRELRESVGGAPPEDWAVTSDSLSAWIATVVKAEELVLLKSRTPTGSTPDRWAEEALVDGYFPVAAKSINRVRAVNLRAES